MGGVSLAALAKVARTGTGWTAEIVIPTQSLQFASTLGAWGLNVSRYVPRDQLTLRWTGITLNSDVFDLHRTGTLPAWTASSRDSASTSSLTRSPVTTMPREPENPEVDAEYEDLDTPFPVAPGVDIPAGQYRFDQFTLMGRTPQSKPLVVTARVTKGDFYTGRIEKTFIKTTWAARDGQLQLGLSNENDFGRLPQGHFIIRLTQLNAAYSFSPSLALTAFAQYDTVTQWGQSH